MKISNQSLVEPFHVLVKPAGASCNLACNYCFYRAKKLHQESPQQMSEELLDSFIKQLIELEPSREVVIAWQGGEPTLLGLGYYRKAAEIASKYQGDKHIQWTIQTNGILLDDEWCDFFRRKNYLVGISLDGPKEVHDAYRVDNQGNGTFDRVMHAISLLKKHAVEFNVLCCVHAKSKSGLEIYRFFRDEVGARFVQFIPVVEKSDGGAVTAQSVKPQQWGQFLIDVFDEWVHNDVGEVFVLLFDWTLASWMGLASPACIFQSTCGRALALEKNGDVYSCDHFVDKEHWIGNIEETPLKNMLLSEKQAKFGREKSVLPLACQRCVFLFSCHGECPKNRLATQSTGEPALNYLCEGYKKYFSHVSSYMRTMANLVLNGRSASDIMLTI